MPSRDLWSGIQARIQPDVVSISERPSRHLSRRWLAAAAAALVVATSGVTYLATSRSIAARTGGVTSSATLPPQVAVAQPEPPPVEAEVPSSTSAEVSSAAPKSAQPAREQARSLPSRRASSGTSLASSAPAPLTASDLAFAGEINQLQSVLVQRRVTVALPVRVTSDPAGTTIAR